MKAGSIVQIFYQNKNCRDEARIAIRKFMEASQCNLWPDVTDKDYVVGGGANSSELFALDIEEQLFWECYVMTHDAELLAAPRYRMGYWSQESASIYGHEHGYYSS